VELNPGDVSIHHPNLLHHSERNVSDKRRCGLDIGYISTTTRIRADGVYLNPLLARGNPVPGINEYRAVPEYMDGETIHFFRARSNGTSRQGSAMRRSELAWPRLELRELPRCRHPHGDSSRKVQSRTDWQ